MAVMLAERRNAASSPLVVLIPLSGFSAFDRPGGPFYESRTPLISKYFYRWGDYFSVDNLETST
jgi:uncharacterized protein (UPF0261 family)